jgi:CRP-like cAMP-binding protein
LVPISRPAGSILIAEGEVGDRFYFIETGEVVVSQPGREIGRLGPGESFGELALVRRIPRTATVVAATDVEMLALDRASFLLAITSSTAALDEADRAAGAFLARDKSARLGDFTDEAVS